ncbi:unnamed protein product [Bursaphelenchus okinawaensis]|uniref:ATP synthase-coupling factor B n=1 Tax=Bursaphelenchus okinawaensis TaxID=465554 RepID=A0A811L2R3_9BILA|nr:unnamed protein product [Bursaphelenchus okinawaensis]CAG9117702.1 unnamed protein product [Bursaphelenchus okinawaensis]
MWIRLLRVRQVPTTSTASLCTGYTRLLERTAVQNGRRTLYKKRQFLAWEPISSEDIWEAMQIRRTFAKFAVNNYSFDRVAAFGPDLACLEWLMNAGATAVKMHDGTTITSQKQMREYLKSFNLDTTKLTPLHPNIKPLTLDELKRFLHRPQFYSQRWHSAPEAYIEEVDATDSAIVDPGFQYFLELKSTKKLIMNFCDYFYNDAIRILCAGRLRHTLEEIEICFNGHIDETAFSQIARLKGLKRAHFYMNPWIKSEQRVRAILKQSLPRLELTYPEMGFIGLGKTPKQENQKAKEAT